MLLPTEVNPISKKQGYKENKLRPCGIGHVEIVFALLTEVIAFHMKAIIIQVGVLGLESPILRYGVCFTIFLDFNK